jgi:hypothetical protein
MSKLWYSEEQEGAKDKLEQLSRVSNPKKVIENAQRYFNDPDVRIYLSTRKNSKYAIYDPKNDKLVHFGNIDYYDYTKHQNEERRENYIKRASNIRGNWRDNPYSPNNLAINLLWI